MGDEEKGNLINTLRLALKDAYSRVDNVLDDEIAVVQSEINEEKEIPTNEADWNGKLLRVGALAPDIDYIEGAYIYPGNRTLAQYEDGSRYNDLSLVYAFESVVFSFILLSKIGEKLF